MLNIIESNLKFNGPLTYGNNPNRILLHHAEISECTIQDIHQWHLNNGWLGCGYHFFVRKDGTVYRGRPENAIGSHCPGQNRQSIGICAEGEYMAENMPQVQKSGISQLCEILKAKYGITEVSGHKKYYNTDCPGINYPLLEIAISHVEEVGEEPLTTILKQQISALQYWLNVDYSAKIKSDGLIRQELYDNLTSVGRIIIKGHKSHLILWIQQKLIMWNYLKPGMTTGIYDEDTFQAITELQKNWEKPTSGIISLDTWNIFLNN